MKQILKYFIAITFLIGALMAPHFTYAEDTVISGTEISSNLEERGKQFRTAFDAAYKEKCEAKFHGDFLKPVIIKYIPPETSTTDADKILLNAGFKLDTDGDDNARETATIEKSCPTFHGDNTVGIMLGGPSGVSVIQIAIGWGRHDKK